MRQHSVVKIVIVLLLLLPGCKKVKEVVQEVPLNYLALGDSYTIGESVAESQRYPVLLVNRLREDGYMINDPLIIAKTGWTTDELAAGIDARQISGPYDMVSLLIGVNNQYRGRDVANYRDEFRALLQQAVGFAGGREENVFVLSIPDWGVTPFAASRDREIIAKEIDQYNAVNRDETENRGILYVDVTPISRQALEDPSLIAADGLHPSGKMYAAWVDLALPGVTEIVNQIVKPAK
ncbi:MAG: SGNH/GDSL hydrolase family protein [candidate division KSB1 bacterium]|jgi:lysophospholipase L1-like esterase|nr:SGNH/GDSL hydrolase family protein [candidate division KSB1 bacterium]